MWEQAQQSVLELDCFWGRWQDPIGDMPTAEVPNGGMIQHISSACMPRGTRSQE
jgi:hypothetical protein